MVMMSTKQILQAGLLSGLMAVSAVAQTNVSSTSTVKREGEAVLPEKLTATDASTDANLRPDRLERDRLSPEVRKRLERFKVDARNYLNKEQELKKQLEGANDKDRAAIREKLRQRRDQWQEQSRELRKEFQDRQRELQDKLPDYREVLDSARNAALDAAKQAQEDTRPHRGED